MTATPEELARYLAAAYDNPAPRTTNIGVILAHLHHLAVVAGGVNDQDGIARDSHRVKPASKALPPDVRLPYKDAPDDDEEVPF